MWACHWSLCSFMSGVTQTTAQAPPAASTSTSTPQVTSLPPDMSGKKAVRGWMTKLHGMPASYELNEEEVGRGGWAACMNALQQSWFGSSVVHTFGGDRGHEPRLVLRVCSSQSLCCVHLRVSSTTCLQSCAAGAAAVVRPGVGVQ